VPGDAHPYLVPRNYIEKPPLISSGGFVVRGLSIGASSLTRLCNQLEDFLQPVRRQLVERGDGEQLDGGLGSRPGCGAEQVASSLFVDVDLFLRVVPERANPPTEFAFALLLHAGLPASAFYLGFDDELHLGEVADLNRTSIVRELTSGECLDFVVDRTC